MSWIVVDLLSDHGTDHADIVGDRTDVWEKIRDFNACLTVFFEAKGDEIVLMFKDAQPEDKNKVVELLNEISIQFKNKWQTILQK